MAGLDPPTKPLQKLGNRNGLNTSEKKQSRDGLGSKKGVAGYDLKLPEKKQKKSAKQIKPDNNTPSSPGFFSRFLQSISQVFRKKTNDSPQKQDTKKSKLGDTAKLFADMEVGTSRGSARFGDNKSSGGAQRTLGGGFGKSSGPKKPGGGFAKPGGLKGGKQEQQVEQYDDSSSLGIGGKGSINAISEITDDDQDQGGGWLVTFADMVTLLLAFFIILYSFSNMDAIKFKKAMASIQTTLHGDYAYQFGVETPQEIPQEIPPEIEVETPQPKKVKTEVEIILEDLSELIHQKGMEKELELNLKADKILIRIKNQLVFRSGSAALNPAAFSIFDDIMSIVDEYPSYMVNIKGHTDNIPIATLQFPSNWELSAIRATTVLRYFIHKGFSPLRITATGYGDVLPLAVNDSVENRALNRRVEFVLEKNIR